MPWGTERRDRGPNAIKWSDPGELGELFSDGTPKKPDESEEEDESSTAESSASDTSSSSGASGNESSASSTSGSSGDESSEADESNSGTSPSGETTILEGLWRRVALQVETIEFRGNQFVWAFGEKVISAGEFSIEGNEVVLHGMGGVAYDYEINGDIMIFNSERDDAEYRRE
jgi:hypothetical protein